MRVICPRCEARCDQSDMYCPTCGAGLRGALREQEADTSSDRGRNGGRGEESRRTSPEPTLEGPAATRGASTAGSNASSEADNDFIPLRFETPNEDWRSSGRRWIVLLLGLIVLLSVGTAVALLRDGDNERDAPADLPAIVEKPTLASPTATSLQVVVASPIPTADGSSAQTRGPSTPATPVQPRGAATPSAAVESAAPEQPIDTTSIAEGARLQTAALTGLAGPSGGSDFTSRSTPEDGAAGGVLTPPLDSDVPLIGPPDPEATSDKAGE